MARQMLSFDCGILIIVMNGIALEWIENRLFPLSIVTSSKLAELNARRLAKQVI